MFQQTVNRNFTQGFPGDIVRDGPRRGKVGRFVPFAGTPNGNQVVDAGNVITRAFGYAGDLGVLGDPATASQSTVALESYQIVAGGSDFFGILGHPKHYVLSGTQDGGTLAASMALPMGSEGECFDMVTGLVVQLYNPTAAVQNVKYGDQLCYISAEAVAATLKTQQDAGAMVAPTGGLFSLPAGDDLASITDIGVVIPNARVMTTVSIPAAAKGAPASTYVIVQLTQ